MTSRRYYGVLRRYVVVMEFEDGEQWSFSVSTYSYSMATAAVIDFVNKHKLNKDDKTYYLAPRLDKNKRTMYNLPTFTK